jgi:TonB-linked SusC/RagA family outer membrane protein
MGWSVATAQQTRISGTVTGENNTPLVGVTVQVKNTGKGVTTDAGGHYTITAAANAVLVFSYIGYSGQEVQIKGRNTIDITLSPGAEGLREIVVTALGIKKSERKIGYALQTVEGDELVKVRTSNPIDGLVGKVSGLDVGVNNELLGTPEVLLRGNQVYLYVVDGIPITSDTWNISPDDIETYTILKGPAAAALYGNRAINGAILITTKKGAKNKKGWVVSVNSSTQLNKGFLVFPKVQNEYGPGEAQKYEFVDGKGGGINDADYDIWGPKFEGQLIPQFDSPIDPATGKRIPTPWLARGKNNLQNFLRTGLLSTNNISLSSSADNYDVRFSLSNTYQRGIVPNTKLNSANFNIYGSYQPSKRIKIEANVNYSRQTSPNYPDVIYGPNSIIYDIALWAGADWDIRDLRNYWQPGKVGVQQYSYEYLRYNNPWFMAYEWLRGHYKTDVYGYVSLNYKITDDLDLTVRSGVSTYNIFRNEKFPWSMHTYDRADGLGDYGEDRRNLFDNNTEAFFNFKKEVVKGIELNATLGGNVRNFNYNSSYVSTNDQNTPEVYSLDNSVKPINATSFHSNMLVLSAYYSVDISLGKYATLSATGREDKSSALLPSHNAFFYPSFSLSSVISDYINLPAFISFLKIRASYANVKDASLNTAPTIGLTPNGSITDGNTLGYSSPYGGPVYAISSVYSTEHLYLNQNAAYYTNTVIDPNIVSYNRSSIEGGLDFRFLEDRLGLSATYYEYIDGPQIFSQHVSQTSGFTNYLTNAVKTTKKGIELTLSGTPVKHANGFTWNIVANWSTYKERYTQLPPGQSTILTHFHKGDRVDELWGDKVITTKDGEIINDASGIPIHDPYPYFLGYGNPDWIWGIHNELSYKNFSISFQFDGRVGGVMVDWLRYKMFEAGRGKETVEGKQGEARYQDFLHANDPDYQGTYVGSGVVVSNGVAIQYDPTTGEITNYGDLKFAPNTHPAILQNYNNNYTWASSFLIKKTYAKLREVALTYMLPSRLLDKTFVSSLSISLVGSNLLYFANPANKDIDLDQYPGSALFPDLQTPTTRSLGININATF